MISPRDEKSVDLEFTKDELEFLAWAMDFIEGGPHDFEGERKTMRDRFAKAISENFHKD